MYLIKKDEIIRSAPNRWEKQYKNYTTYSGHGLNHSEITKRLLALEPGFTEDQVADIIGNPSWTKLNCDECGNDSDELVHFGEEVDYDATYADVCFICIMKASRMPRI